METRLVVKMGMGGGYSWNPVAKSKGDVKCPRMHRTLAFTKKIYPGQNVSSAEVGKSYFKGKSLG